MSIGSVTTRRGGLSKITMSAFSSSSATTSRMREERSTCGGSGGSGPAGIIRNPAISVGLKTSAIVPLPKSRWVSPFCSRRSKSLCMAGLRRSVSTKSTLFPPLAMEMARLTAVVVLPSSGLELVTSKLFKPEVPTAANSRFVWRNLYASVKLCAGSSLMIKGRASLLPRNLTTEPIVGIPARFLIPVRSLNSSGDLTRSSRYSRSITISPATNSPRTAPRSTLSWVRGADGLEGGTASSTMPSRVRVAA